MMNRLRTAFVSVTAVAVAMMVLGSNARAQSLSSLEKKASSLETKGKSLVGLLKRLEKRKPQTLALHKKEWSVFSLIQANIGALQADQIALLAMEASASGKKLKSIQRELKSIQTRVAAERGVATPVQ